MLKLQDIMTRDLVTLSPEHSLREAMSTLTSHHISGAPVLANGKVVGVVSLTDLAEFAAAAPGVPRERPEQAEWGEWAEPTDPVEGEDPPSSFFAQLWDDAGAEVAERIEETDGPEWNVLAEHTVGEVMTRAIHALAPESSVEFAADGMRTLGIHRVLVMDGNTLLGIVTTKDISDAVADHRLVRRTFVFQPSEPGR
ncbi:MAG TPA: CBS domain-containing protein [Gemmatimonadaceae bacterium]|nr:CBS domain-containing protein [Gemmatimonadaceae bacterium]